MKPIESQTLVVRPFVSGIVMIALLCGGLLLTGRPGAATEQLDSSVLDRLIADSDAIVVAIARDVRAAWQTNGHGDQIIVSGVALDVIETLKGRPDRTRSLQLEGGTVDGITLEVSDEPQVQSGERALFFLTSRAANLDRPAGGDDAVLPLDEQDTVRDRGISLEDVRRRVRGLGR
jgi:hypothetical protein